MTSLQLILIAAGVVIVAVVLVYNRMQERRIRRQIDRAFGQSHGRGDARRDEAEPVQDRVEPTLPGAVPENAPRARVSETEGDGNYEPPLAIQKRIASDLSEDDYTRTPRSEPSNSLDPGVRYVLASWRFLIRVILSAW